MNLLILHILLHKYNTIDSNFALTSFVLKAEIKDSVEEENMEFYSVDSFSFLLRYLNNVWRVDISEREGKKWIKIKSHSTESLPVVEI